MTYATGNWVIEVATHLNKSPSADPIWFAVNHTEELTEEAEMYRQMSDTYWKQRNMLLSVYDENILESFSPTSKEIRELFSFMAGKIGLNADTDEGSFFESRYKLSAFFDYTVKSIADIQTNREVLQDYLGFKKEELTFQKVEKVHFSGSFMHQVK